MTRDPGRYLHLTLALEAGSDPIVGYVAQDEREGQRFVGWLELMSTLERVSSVQRRQQEETT